LISRILVTKGLGFFSAVGMAQEELDSIKVGKLKAMVVKVDLSKEYDRVSWIYLQLMSIHLGFCAQFVTWVMNCITYVSFSILINGAATKFFRLERGRRQGCPFYPLLFLIAAEDLSGALKEALRARNFKGIKFANTCTLSHLFVDDILIFSYGSRRDASRIKDIIDLFCLATGMQINVDKYHFLLWYR
jgi:hypothetical protein